MLKSFALTLALLTLCACGTTTYTPTEYPLRAGLIPPIASRGAATIANEQPSTEQVIVYSESGRKLATTYQAVTQLMADQATKELQKPSPADADGTPKVIGLKITYMKSSYRTFHWRSELHYVATLGDGTTFEKVVNHATGMSMLQDLNGVIADSVVDLLRDTRVRNYLEQ